jgi:hypothetical protein
LAADCDIPNENIGGLSRYEGLLQELHTPSACDPPG